MVEQKLKQALARLKEALEETAPDDIQSKELVEKLVTHLKEKSQTLSHPYERAQILHMLNEKMLHFETSHPRITGILEEIIGILTRMGI